MSVLDKNIIKHKKILSEIQLDEIESFDSQEKQVENSLYDSIDTIYYINIKFESIRNSYMKRLLKNHFPDKKIDRFEAITPETLHLYEKYFEYEKVELEDGRMGRDGVLSERGKKIISCYLSHLLCLKKAVDTPDGLCLIFEDDTYFDDKFIKILKSVDVSVFDNYNIDILRGINQNSSVDFGNYTENAPKTGGVLAERLCNYIYSLPNLNTPSMVYEGWPKAPNIWGNNLLIYNPKKALDIYNTIVNFERLMDYDMVLNSINFNHCVFNKYIFRCGLFISYININEIPAGIFSKWVSRKKWGIDDVK